VASRFNSFLGKSMFNGWMLRKKIAETRRPRLVKGLAWLTGAAGLLVLAEGILTAWFPQHVAPARWELDFVFGRFPWMKSGQWLAGACLLVIGIVGLYAGMVLARRRQLGAYFTMVLIAILLATCIVLLYTGIRFDAVLMTWAGAINLGVSLALSVVLGLSWYSLDPLGLHWEPHAGAG
jgi:hypothetical protein